MADVLGFSTRQTWQVATINPQRRKLAIMLALADLVLFFGCLALIFLVFVWYWIRHKRTAKSPSEKDPTRPSSNDSGAFTHVVTGSGITALATAAAFGSVLAGSIATLLTSTGSYLVALAPILVPLMGLWLTSTALVFYSQSIFPVINTLNLNWIRPGFDFFINPILTLVLVIYQAIYGVWVTILRLVAYAMYGPLLVLMQCSFNLIETLLFDIGRVAVNFIYAISFWVGNNPIFTEIPLRDTFLAVGQLLYDIWVGPATCFCSILNYIVGGIGKSFNNPNLADALTGAVNFALVLPMGLIVRPIINNEAPQINRIYQLQSGTFVSLGKWMENVTTLQFDVWIYGGATELLVKQVNGTAPLPTDDLKYLVFFLQSEWAEMVFHYMNAFFALVLWEPLNLAFQSPQIFSLQGAAVFKFDMLRNESLAAIDGLSTVLDIAPLCQNPGFSANYGSLVSPLRAAVWLIQAISDIIVGELYLLFAGQVPGLFLATYFLSQAPPLVHFELEVEGSAAILGCIVAYLDGATGKTLEGFLTALIVWLPRIPFQVLAFVRYILQTGQVSVLDSVDIAAFEQALLQVSLIGEIFYQFQPGATNLTCPNQVTFFCALGYGLQQFLTFLFELIIIYVKSLINVLKIVVGGLASGTLAEVQPPDFSIMINAGYAAACRIGVLLGTFIPLDIPCMGNELGFCQVKEFPGQITSTVSICMATFLCKVGNYLMVPIDILATMVRYVVSFNFTNSSLIVMAVREVLNIIVYRILSPLCPLAHFFDCIFDVLVGGGQKAATGFFCLITGALVFLLQTLGDIIVQLLQWIINVIIFIFGGFTQADAAKVLLDLIIEFLTIIGTTLEKVFLAVLNLVLSVFFSILVAICRTINFFVAFSLTAQCNQLEASLNNVLGGGATNFFSPQYTNYKKRDATTTGGGDEEEPLRNANGCQRSTIDRIQVYAIEALDAIYTDYPSLRPANDIFGIEEERARLNVPLSSSKDDDTPKEEKCEENEEGNRKKRAAVEADRYQQLILQTFGPGPTDPQRLTEYLYGQVQWEMTSKCWHMLTMLKDTRWDQVGVSEKLTIMDCITDKMIAVGISKTYAPMSWLPEDIIYNWRLRAVMLGVGTARFALVATNWAVDRTVSLKRLITPEYQRQWQTLRLDVSHYNTTLKPWYPANPATATAFEWAPLIVAVKNLTLHSYLVRNFPSIYSAGGGRDPILDPLQSMYSFMGDFAMNGLLKMKDQANATLQANETSMYADGQYASSTTVYSIDGHDLNNRTAIWLEYGDDAVAAYDTRVSTQNLYTSLSAFVMGMWEWGGRFGELFQQRSGLSNFKRTVESAAMVPSSAYAQFGRLRRVAADRYAHSMNEMYRGARAFQPDRPRTFVVHAVSTLGEMAAHYMGSRVTAVPPWCIQLVARATNVSYDQVITDATNTTEMAMKCRDESWRQSLLRVGVNVDGPGGFWSSPLGWLYNVTRPRTPLAVANRQAVVQLAQSAASTVWNAYYVMLGSDYDPDTFSRIQQVQMETAPDFATYYHHVRNNNNATAARQNREDHPHTQAHPGNERQEGVPWQVTQLDFDMWKNKTQFNIQIDTPAKLKVFFFGGDPKNKKAAATTSGQKLMRTIGEWRHQMVDITSEYLYHEYDKQVMQAAVKAMRQNPGRTTAKGGLIFEPRSKKVRQDLGGATAVRLSVELNGHLYDTELNTRQNTLLVVRRLNGMAMAATPTFLNLTGILEKTCMSTSDWLCQNCYFADQVVGLLITRAVYLYNYYTGYFITLTADTIPYLQYTFLDNATVISGNGSNSPWIPALNEPLGTFLQFSQDEIDNGLSLTLWLEAITGKAFPSLITDGPLATMLRNYTTQLDPLGQPFERSLLLDILVFIEYRLGWRLLELIDTLIVYFEGSMSEVGDYAVHHLAFCTYTVEIDCSQRHYSFAGGAVVALFWYLVAGVAAYFILMPFQFALAGVYLMFIVTFPFFHAIITYGWSVRCVALPQCYFKELWDLWVYTLYPKCLPTLGAFVSSANYTADTCFNRNNQWQWVSCQELGFRNIFDSLTYLKLWLNEDLGLGDALRDLYAQFGLNTDTTIDFAAVPWETDPVVYRNFGGCTTLTLLPYAIAGVVLLLVGIVVVGTLLTLLPSLIASFFIFIVSAAAFMFFALLEIDYNFISRSATEAEEAEFHNRPEGQLELPPVKQAATFIQVGQAALGTLKDFVVRRRNIAALFDQYDRL